MKSEQKVISLHMLINVGALMILIFNFNLEYFLYSLIFGYFIINIGSLAIHRWLTHKTFEPRNQIVSYTLYFIIVLMVTGPIVHWIALHRYHHLYSDTENDPHSPLGKTFWGKVKLWFGDWKLPDEMSPKLIIDVIRDTKVVFINKYYYTLLTLWMILLATIDMDLFMYGFVVSSMVAINMGGLFIVTSHIFGSRDFETSDHSLNNSVVGFFLWETGWHNNHHAFPNTFEIGHNWKQIDIGKHIIKLIAKPDSLKYYEGNK